MEENEKGEINQIIIHTLPGANEKYIGKNVEGEEKK